MQLEGKRGFFRCFWAMVGLLVLSFMGSASVKDSSPESKDSNPEDTLRVDVSLVTLGLLATDSKKHEVVGLKAEDFSVYEDGRLQKLTFFSAEKQPISLVLLLDRSNSMNEGNKMEQAKKAALSLVESICPGSEFLYFVFHHHVTKALDFTTDRERVKTAIARTAAGHGGTSFYDGILQGIEQVARAKHQRQALVVVTDGVDEHSQHTLDDVIQAVQSTHAELFMIGCFSRQEDEFFRRSGRTVPLPGGRETDNPRFSFNKLAEESGAECYFPQSDLDLYHAVSSISRDLGNQYTLAYYAPGTPRDEHYRKIQVKVRRRGVKIRARKGYSLRRLAGD